MNDFTLDDIIAILRRRWLLIVAPLLVGVPIAVAIALMLPAQYASTARILVESQQIPSNLAQSTVNQSAAERIQLIQQRLLTRQNLLVIAEQFNVVPQDQQLTPTEVVALMRSSSSIRGTSASLSNRRDSLVTGIDITFRARSSQLAAQVANEFVSRVLAQNIEQRTNQATGTLSFFNNEVERLSSELDAQSQRIARFTLENQDTMPSSLDAREGELRTLRDRAVQRELQRIALEEERRQLEEAIEIGVETVATDGSGPRARELERLRLSLVQQRAMLADTHPRVRQLTAQIAALENAPDNEEGAPDTTESGRAATALSRVDAINERLTLLDDQAEQDSARTAQLEDSISRTPQIGLQLAALERDYAALQTQYREAVLKQAQAETGERLESSQQAERFEVIEQAIPSESPVSPNRPHDHGCRRLCERRFRLGARRTRRTPEPQRAHRP
jgi:uncharacterized protein involved in exopolysaccharide biosynthesis